MKRKPQSSIWIFSPDTGFAKRFPSDFELVINPALSAKDPEKPVLAAFDSDGYPLPQCLEAIASVKNGAASPSVPILVVTGRKDKASVLSFLQAGAFGILSNHDPEEKLRIAIQDIIAGNQVLSGPAVSLVISSIDLARSASQQEIVRYDLTDSEIDLLRDLSHGLTKKEIAERKGRSVHTIDNHFRRVYEKLGVNHMGEAIGKAFRCGLID